ALSVSLSHPLSVSDSSTTYCCALSFTLLKWEFSRLFLINESHWIQLKNQIDHYLNKLEYQGVVITHGTNTMEEPAYFLHLTVNSDKPVVLVGAQRPFTALSSDAHL